MHTGSRTNTVTENVINVLEHFFNDFFLLFLIFPRGSGAYFDGIFDQKFVRPKSAKIYGAKVGRSDPKVGGVIWVPNSPRLENHGKSSKLSMF